MPPFNGSGSYSLPAGNPVVTGSVISSATQNTTMSDVATGLTNALCKDGQSTPTANLKMGGYKFTNLGTGSARTDSVSLGQAQDQGYLLLSSVAGVDTITASVTPAITAYAAGQCFRFVSAGANASSVTLNINSLGAKAVTKNGTTALSAGDIPSGAVCQVVYDGTRFQLIGVVADRLSLGGGTLTGTLSFDQGNIIFYGDSGSIEVAGNSATGTRVITLPDATGTAVLDTATQTLTNKTINGGTVISASAQATTSGTTKDFSSIPSWVKRITVLFNGVSTNGTSNLMVQIGDSGGLETSGYSGAVSTSGGGTITSYSAGFLATSVLGATDTVSGSMTISLIGSNTWVQSGTISQSSSQLGFGGGTKTLTDTLDRLRVTTVSGDTFDAGSVNILYE